MNLFVPHDSDNTGYFPTQHQLVGLCNYSAVFSVMYKLNSSILHVIYTNFLFKVFKILTPFPYLLQLIIKQSPHSCIILISMSYWLCPWVVAQSWTSETSETIYESTKSNIPEDSNLERKSVVGTLNLGQYNLKYIQCHQITKETGYDG